MSEHHDIVSTALETVDYSSYTTHADGSKVRESSAPEIIESLVRACDLREGMRVLEIGTGSGFSGALLGSITGLSGHVTSVDIDPGLVDRAARLHAQRGTTNVTVIVGNGYDGVTQGAPYDRIVAWTCPPELPKTWVKQLAADALIVTPLPAVPVTTGSITARIVVINGRPQVQAVMEGSFVPFHGPDGFDVSMLTLPGTQSVTVEHTTVALCTQGLTTETTHRHALGLAQSSDSGVNVDFLRSLVTDDAERLNLRWWLLSYPNAAEGFADGELFVGQATPSGAAVYELDTGTVRSTGDPVVLTDLMDSLTTWAGLDNRDVSELSIDLDATATGWSASLHA